MSDEDEDYMSDKFLASVADVRPPSLIKDRAKKRQVQVAKEQQAHIKRQRDERVPRTSAQRNEQLQEALQRPIEQGNRGFQLLAKMGYKPGEALGKASTAGALTTPIGISIKMDRGGLGREAALQELAERRQQLRAKHLLRMCETAEPVTTEQYRQRVTAKAEERFLLNAIRKCQGTCENLDITLSNLEQPNISWFWPERVSAEPETDTESATEIVDKASDKEDNDDEELEYSSAEKLELLLNYMRTAYSYCHWCGVQYKDAEDLRANCAGLTREEH